MDGCCYLSQDWPTSGVKEPNGLAQGSSLQVRRACVVLKVSMESYRCDLLVVLLLLFDEARCMSRDLSIFRITRAYSSCPPGLCLEN